MTLAYRFIFDHPLLIPSLVAGFVFIWSIAADRKSRVGVRGAVALLFTAGSFVLVAGAMSSFLIHDEIRPGDVQAQGWEAVLSFGRAFLPSLLAGFVCWSLGFLVRWLAHARFLSDARAR